MKTVGILLLVVLLLVVGLPLAMDMGMVMEGDCPACVPGASAALMMCLAILALMALVLSFSYSRVFSAWESNLKAGFLDTLFRPPRTV